jgi:hypothetical protein
VVPSPTAKPAGTICATRLSVRERMRTLPASVNASSKFESQATPQCEVVLIRLSKCFHRSTPGQGSAKVRSATKSTFA